MSARRLTIRPRAATALIVLAFWSAASLLAPHDPHLIDLTNRLQPPSAEYWLGTDAMGRCVLSRMLYGGQATLGVVLVGGLSILLLGMATGLPLGYYKGRFSAMGESLLQALTAFPSIAYLIVFAGAWGSGLATMLTAITLAGFVRLAKLVKTRAEVEREKAYVLCARACGAGHCRILFRHIAPNIRKDAAVFLALTCSDMILMLAAFSFIGLGLGDGVVEWGGMVLEGSAVSLLRPDMLLYPLAPIFLCAVAFNLLSEELQ